VCVIVLIANFRQQQSQQDDDDGRQVYAVSSFVLFIARSGSLAGRRVGRPIPDGSKSLEYQLRVP
jgi:hypothetical protein